MGKTGQQVSRRQKKKKFKKVKKHATKTSQKSVMRAKGRNPRQIGPEKSRERGGEVQLNLHQSEGTQRVKEKKTQEFCRILGVKKKGKE